jgi:TolA-binding protein
MPESIPDNAALTKLAQLARELSTAPVSSEVHEDGRNRIMALAASRQFPRKAVPTVTKVAVSVFAAAAAFAVVFWSTTRVRPITYEIAGGSRFESGYLSASPDRSAMIRFSDGSAIDAAPGTRLRVDSTQNDGARVLLERGSADARIYHGKTSSWLFVAGPFEVKVVGTHFNLTWDPSKEEVDLTLDEGAVELRSPLGQGPFVVRKGQKFHASLLTRSVRMEDGNAMTASATEATQEAPAASVQESANDPRTATGDEVTAPSNPNSAANTPKSSGPRRDSWQALVSQGRFRSVVEAAETRGVDSCLSSCSLGDVRALADAARYTGRSDLAERSLLAIRQRAAAGSQRSAAAFLLGRSSESRGQVSSASTWYDTYLSESPNGEFAADALAGKMRVTVRTQGSAAARPLAMQYLQRYPNGVHADAARKIAGTN